MSGLCSGRSANSGAKPAAISQRLRSRSGRASASASCSTIARLGRALADSRKLRWRCDKPASAASAIWLKPWPLRRSRNRWEKSLAASGAAAMVGLAWLMAAIVRAAFMTRYYLPSH